MNCIKDKKYPADELEWLAITLFNHAIDLYCNSQDEECLQWADKALEVAGEDRSHGGLYEMLKSKLDGLQLVWG